MAAANIPMYVDYVYELIKADCKDCMAINENYIRNQVGTMGLNALLENKLLGGLGEDHGVPVYAILEKES